MTDTPQSIIESKLEAQAREELRRELDTIFTKIYNDIPSSAYTDVTFQSHGVEPQQRVTLSIYEAISFIKDATYRDMLPKRVEAKVDELLATVTKIQELTS
jgi:hypothetical protein